MLDWLWKNEEEKDAPVATLHLHRIKSPEIRIIMEDNYMVDKIIGNIIILKQISH